MRMDRRVKYDVEVRRKAAELFASGMGSCTVASRNLCIKIRPYITTTKGKFCIVDVFQVWLSRISFLTGSIDGLLLFSASSVTFPE